MAQDKSLIVEPPAIARFRESSADSATVATMADTIKSLNGQPGWVTNGEVYSEHSMASADSAVYKRAVAKALGAPDFKMRTRVWGTDSKGAVLTDTDKPGNWQFVVRYDPEREKSVRKS